MVELTRARGSHSQRRSRWVGWLLFAFVPGAGAATGSPALADYSHDTWTTREGLPHNTVLDIAQTGDGYLWFGTWEGLARYNGIGFHTFARNTSPALPDNAVSAVHADAGGRLWTGDARGNLGRRERDGQWRFWGARQGVPVAGITAIASDARQRVCVAQERMGVGCLDGDAFVRVPLPAGMETMTGLRFARGDDGRLWLGTLTGLFYLDAQGRLQPAPAGFGLAPGMAWPYRDRNGGIWVIAGENIYRMRGDRLVLARTVAGSGRFSAMLRDSYGDLWLGTENRGLLRIGSRGMEWIDRRRGLPEGRISALFQDRENSIWVGVNGGLYRLRETPFSSYTREDGLASNYVRALLEDRAGNLWIGSSGGLDRLGADLTMATVPLAGAADAGAISVLSLAQGQGDDIWVGSYGDGVLRLREGRVMARFGTSCGLPSAHVRAIAMDAGGTLWLGTRRGVASIDPIGAVHVLDAPGVPRGQVFALAATGHGLWIGSFEGATLWRDGQARRIDIAALGNAGSVTSFHEDAATGAMWISSDRGLYRYRYRDGQLAHVGIEDGLPVDAVFQMVVDRAGSAWLGSNRGMLRIGFAELNRVADGQRTPLRGDLFGTMDGMASSQGNGASGPTTLLRRDGSVWVATAGGVSTVQPSRLERFRIQPPPPVVIEDVELDGVPSPVQGDKPMRIAPEARRMAISYVGLSYLLPQGIRYRTLLDGFDKDWVERGNQHVAEFTSLPPGDYVFRVTAANVGGKWNPQEARFRFTVEPSLWQRTGFRVVMAMLGLLLLAGIYRFRELSHRRNAERLERLVEERTHDLTRQGQRLARADEEKGRLLEQLRLQADSYERLAHEDALTGLPNRRRFDEVLAHEFARSSRNGQPWCLAIIDIDHFKRINDRYSHAVGDEALRAVAATMLAGDRGMDTVARLGGEEFALLMPDTTRDAALVACERMRAAIAAHEYGDIAEGLAVTVSIGLAAWPGHASPEAMLAVADAALYRAKDKGRNRVEAG